MTYSPYHLFQQITSERACWFNVGTKLLDPPPTELKMEQKKLTKDAIVWQEICIADRSGVQISSVPSQIEAGLSYSTIFYVQQDLSPRSDINPLLI